MEQRFNSGSVLVRFVDLHGDATQSPEVAAAFGDQWLPHVAQDCRGHGNEIVDPIAE